DRGVRGRWRERGRVARGIGVPDLAERLRVHDAVPPESQRENRPQRLLPAHLREPRGDEGARVSAPRERGRGRNLKPYRLGAAVRIVLRRSARADRINETRKSTVRTSTIFEIRPSASTSSMVPIGQMDTVRVTT